MSQAPVRTPAVEELYPLTPLQRGLLFHTLAAPADGVYVVQVCYQLRGPLDPDALELAWRQVVQAHPVLRSAFVWEQVERPLQAVLRHVDLPLARHDWSGLAAGEQPARLERFLAEDRERGFTPARPPLLRLALIRLGEHDHELVWSYHHLLLDGWSAAIVVDHLLDCYRAARRGRPVASAAPRPFRDYVAWLERQDLEAARAYWRGLLAGFDTPTALPAAAPRPAAADGTRTYRRHELRLSAQRLAELREAARRGQFTLATLLVGAWGLLLARYGGDDDVCLGATVAARPADLPGADGMVGLFVNTLPVRLRTPPEAHVLPWLRDLQEQLAHLAQHGHSPLAEVQRCAALPPGRSLFDTVVAFENYPSGGAEGDGAVEEVRLVAARSAERIHYPLVLAAQPGRELLLELHYDGVRYDEPTVARLAGHLVALLDGIAAQPDRRLGDLSMLTARERVWLLAAGAGPDAPIPDAPVHQLIAAQARRSPNAVAVDFHGEPLAYGELLRRASRLASHLRRLGTGPETRIGVCLERGPDMVVGVLAALFAGGAYVPLDPAHPARRQDDVLRDAGAATVVSAGSLGERLETAGHNVVRLDAHTDRIAAEPAEPPVPLAGLDHAAYVVYTSGSTGRPKGVVVEHRSLVNYVTQAAESYGIDERTRMLAMAPLAFDASVLELFTPLAHGGCVVLAGEDDRRSAAQMQRRLRDGRVTTAFLPPALARLLHPDDLPDLRIASVGGEAVPGELVGRWASPARRFFNAYGPTETTVIVTQAEWTGTWEVPPPIGRPLPNHRLYVLDEQLEPVPVGAPGHLYVAGAGVARGYLGRPGLTAERFVPSPHGGRPGERLYRTGDRVRWLPDGTLDFLGRADRQIKLRGFRVELGEIEAVLERHPGVDRAVVEVRDDAAGTPRLVAYLPGAAAPGPAEVRAFLGEHLPDHMLPSRVIRLDELPLTSSGKLDRRALPEPGPQRPELGGLVAPRSPVEEVLAGVWAQVLGVDRVGVDDDFFALGGDSILAMRIAARARQAGLAVSPQALFGHPTVAALAAAAQAVPAEPPPAAAVSGPVPLTPIQRWFFERDDPEPQHYDQTVLLETFEPIDERELARAVERLLDHHDALRLRFDRDGAEWRQRNAARETGQAVRRIDLSGVPAADQPQAVRDAATRCQATRDLATGPTFTVLLFDLGPGRPGRLLLTAHHLVVDVVSWGILLEDLATAYGQLERGEAVRLPAKTASFKRWAARLADYAGSAELRRQHAWWRESLQGATLRLPVDYRTGPDDEASAALVQAHLDPDATRALLTVGGVDAVLLAALGRTLAPWAGPGRLLVDVEHHGRATPFNDLDLTRTVGWFTSLFPVRLQLNPELDPVEALRAASGTLQAVPDHGIGYGVLRYLARADGLAAPVEVSLNYLGQPGAGLREVPSVRPAADPLDTVRSPAAARPFLLAVEGTVQDGRFVATFHYSRHRHRTATVEALAAGFTDAVRCLLVARPTTP